MVEKPQQTKHLNIKTTWLTPSILLVILPLFCTEYPVVEASIVPSNRVSYNITTKQVNFKEDELYRQTKKQQAWTTRTYKTLTVFTLFSQHFMFGLQINFDKSFYTCIYQQFNSIDKNSNTAQIPELWKFKFLVLSFQTEKPTKL